MHLLGSAIICNTHIRGHTPTLRFQRPAGAKERVTLPSGANSKLMGLTASAAETRGKENVTQGVGEIGEEVRFELQPQGQVKVTKF